MNVLILGDGDPERAWARYFDARTEHRITALYPGLAGDEFAGIPVARDLDEALATAGVELVVVGGPIDQRGEALRRSAAEGMAIICLHPPGRDSEPYYQVTLSHAETGAVIVPDLPLRLHPGVGRLRQAIRSKELGDFRVLRHDSSGHIDPSEGGLTSQIFPRLIDPIRALVGEIEALSASGDPPGQDPEIELVVQIRAAGSRRAEVRARSGPPEPSRLTLTGSIGSLTLQYDPSLQEPARLLSRIANAKGEEIEDLGEWDHHLAILDTLLAARDRREAADSTPSPNLLDGTRAMEVAEAVARSLRRGRTIDLHYEQLSEESTFKSVMTSTGCMMLLLALIVLPISLAGPALGFKWTIYIAYLILPALVLFAILQVLRLGIRGERAPGPSTREPDDDNRPT